MSADHTVQLRQDGKVVKSFTTVNGALKYLHDAHSYSWDHALRHEGFSITDRSGNHLARSYSKNPTKGDTVLLHGKKAKVQRILGKHGGRVVALVAGKKCELTTARGNPVEPFRPVVHRTLEDAKKAAREIARSYGEAYVVHRDDGYTAHQGYDDTNKHRVASFCSMPGGRVQEGSRANPSLPVRGGDTIEFWVGRGDQRRPVKAKVNRLLVFPTHVVASYGNNGTVVDHSNFIRVVKKAR